MSIRKELKQQMIEILIAVVLSIIVTVGPSNFFYGLADAFKYSITELKHFISTHR